MTGVPVAHRAVMVGGPQDGQVVEVGRETGGSLYFRAPVEHVDREPVVDLGPPRLRPVARYRYDIAVPFRLNAAGTAVVYEYQGLD